MQNRLQGFRREDVFPVPVDRYPAAGLVSMHDLNVIAFAASIVPAKAERRPMNDPTGSTRESGHHCLAHVNSLCPKTGCNTAREFIDGHACGFAAITRHSAIGCAVIQPWEDPALRSKLPSTLMALFEDVPSTVIVPANNRDKIRASHAIDGAILHSLDAFFAQWELAGISPKTRIASRSIDGLKVFGRPRFSQRCPTSM